MAFLTSIPSFRGIVEYCAQDNNEQYHTLQLGRPCATAPVVQPDQITDLSDYRFYMFSRCPLDGFLLKDVPFDQIIPFVHFFKKEKDRISLFQRHYQGQARQFEEFVQREGVVLEDAKTPPKKQYPAYEPLLSVVEFKPSDKKNAFWVATEFQRDRMCEYVAILEALGYNGEVPRYEHEIEWVERNSKVFRLENFARGGPSDIGDIQYCPRGEHYWHLIRQKGKEDRRFVRKFYIIQVAVDSHDLEEKIRDIPVALCPDAQQSDNGREGILPSRVA